MRYCVTINFHNEWLAVVAVAVAVFFVFCLLFLLLLFGLRKSTLLVCGSLLSKLVCHIKINGGKSDLST